MPGMALHAATQRGHLRPRNVVSSLVLFALVFAALLPLAYVDRFLFWFIAESVGILFCAHAICRGRFVLPPLEAWQLLPMLGTLIASLQVLLGGTSCTYFTAGSVHFWLGALFLLPLFFHGVALSSRWRAAKSIGVAALSAFLVFAFLSGIFAIYFPSPSGVVRWLPFVYRNHYAAFVVLALPLLLAQLTPPRWVGFTAAAGAVCGIAGVVSAGSRAGLGFLILELLVFAALRFRQCRLRSKRERIVLAAACLAGVLLSSGVVWRYRLAAPTSLMDGRSEYWNAALRMIAEKPLTGWGFQTWPDVYRQFATIDTGFLVNRAHSDWLEWTADGGLLIGVALAMSLVWSIRRTLHRPWFLGVPIVLLYGGVDYVLRLPLIFVLMLLLQAAASQECVDRPPGKRLRIPEPSGRPTRRHSMAAIAPSP